MQKLIAFIISFFVIFKSSHCCISYNLIVKPFINYLHRKINNFF
nr:MAG TPA: hypothetical protein [Caudoviricetes sp.]